MNTPSIQIPAAPNTTGQDPKPITVLLRIQFPDVAVAHEYAPPSNYIGSELLKELIAARLKSRSLLHPCGYGGAGPLNHQQHNFGLTALAPAHEVSRDVVGLVGLFHHSVIAWHDEGEEIFRTAHPRQGDMISVAEVTQQNQRETIKLAAITAAIHDWNQQHPRIPTPPPNSSGTEAE
jgi:hypothetical protein